MNDILNHSKNENLKSYARQLASRVLEAFKKDPKKISTQLLFKQSDPLFEDLDDEYIRDYTDHESIDDLFGDDLFSEFDQTRKSRKGSYMDALQEIDKRDMQSRKSQEDDRLSCIMF